MNPSVCQSATCCGPSSEVKHLLASISAIGLPTQERELTAVGYMQQVYYLTSGVSNTWFVDINDTPSIILISMILNIPPSAI
jgi:hypothetical protein